MKLKKLLKYPFVQDFILHPEKIVQFKENLAEFVKDKKFRRKTKINPIEDPNFESNVLRKLNEYRAALGKRRGILKWFGISFFGKPVLALAQKKNVDARKLYEEMLKIPELAPTEKPIFSENKDAKTIILIPDRHGTPKRQYTQLELLRTSFGLNFVGIEGWAGTNADKIRGTLRLNAENDLIKILIRDKRYKIIGLEDEETQRYAFAVSLPKNFKNKYEIENKLEDNLRLLNISLDTTKSILKFVQRNYEKIDFSLTDRDFNPALHSSYFECYAYFNRITNLRDDKMREERDNLSKQITDLTNWFLRELEHLRKNYTPEEAYRKTLELNDIRSDKFNELHKRMNLLSSEIQKIMDARIYLEFYLNLLNELHSHLYLVFGANHINENDLKSCELKATSIVQNLQRYVPLGKTPYDHYAIDLRNNIAVKIIIKAMENFHQKNGLVVFGQGHIKGLVEEFLNQTNRNVNILIARFYEIL